MIGQVAGPSPNRIRSVDFLASLRSSTFLFVSAGLLGAGLVGSLTSNFPLLALVPFGLVLLFVALQLPPHRLCFIVFCISAGTYRGLLLLIRVNIAGVPLGLFDAMWAVALVAVFSQWLRKEGIKFRWVPIFLCMVAVYVAFVGILFHQPTYSVFKLFRAQLLLGVGVLIGQALSTEGRRAVLKALAWGGTATGIAQWITFLYASRGVSIWAHLGVAISDTSEESNASVSNLAGYRDNGVMISFTVVAALILVSAYFASYPEMRRPLYRVLLALCVSAVFVSLTRASWIALAAGCVFMAVSSARFNVSQLIRKAIGPIIVVLLLSPLISTTAAGEAVLGRLGSLRGGAQNETISDRLVESETALRMSGHFLLSGIGAAIVTIPRKTPGRPTVLEVRNQLHNGYANLLMAGGILGLLSVVVLLARCISGSWSATRWDSSHSRQFESMAVSGALVALALTAFTGGVVNDAFYTAVLGCLCGFALTLATFGSTTQEKTRNIAMQAQMNGVQVDA